MSATFPPSGLTPPNAAPNNGSKNAPNARRWLPPMLVQGWRWWTTELGAAFAPLVARYWVDQSNMVDVTLDANGQIPSTAKLAGHDVRIKLPVENVLQKTVSYPAVVEENLHDVIINDLDRQTPFTLSQVYLAHHIVRRYDAADGTAKIDVELTIVMRKIADAALARVRELGGSVYSLSVAGVAGVSGGSSMTNSSHPIELLPEDARPARRLSRLQKTNLALLGVLVAVIAAAIIVPIYLKREQMKALQPMVDKARLEADGSRKIEAEFQRMQQEYQVAMTKKYASVPIIDVVEALTKLSPDTVWLKTLEVKTTTNISKNAAANGKKVREIQIVGEGPSSFTIKMIELLEQSPLLENTVQRGKPAPSSQPNSEEFRITTEIKPRPLPDLIDVLSEAAKGDAAPAISAVPAPALVTVPATPAASSAALPITTQPAPAAINGSIVTVPKTSNPATTPPATPHPSHPSAPLPPSATSPPVLPIPKYLPAPPRPSAPGAAPVSMPPAPSANTNAPVPAPSSSGLPNMTMPTPTPPKVNP